jgi:hypothetical protein
LPVRTTEMIAVLVGVLTVVLLMSLLRIKQAALSLATFEGRFARLITFTGLAILVGRCMNLCTADMFMLTVIASLIYIAFCMLPAVVIAYGLTSSITSFGWLSDIAWLPVFASAIAILLVDVSVRDPKSGAGYRRSASLLIVVAMLANLSMYPTMTTAVVCLLSGVFVLVYGYSFEQRIDFVAGLITVLIGVGYQCVLAFEVFDLGNWGALASVGVLAIVAGSVLEHHGALIRARVGAWQSSFKKWQY